MGDIRYELLQRRFTDQQIDRRTFVKRGAALGLSIPAVSALLAACGGDDDDGDRTPISAAGDATASPSGVTIQANVTTTAATGSPTAAAAGSGEAGGKVTFSRQADSTLLDPPGNIVNADIWIYQSMYDRLVGVADSGLELIPMLAESWEASGDGMAYTFAIRQGVKFSDGSDLSTDDIIFTLNRSKTKEDSPWTFSLDQVNEVSAPDPATIQITLTQIWAPFLSDLSLFSNNILSKAWVEANGEAALADNGMGTGPFALKEWKKGESLTLVRNEHYWEEGLPLIDEVVFLVTPNGNNQILQLQGGEIDGIVGQGDVPFNRISDLMADSSLEVLKFLSTYVNYVGLNCRKPPLDNIGARQALNYATNKRALIDTLLFGIGEISNGYMPNGALYWNPDIEPYPFDLEKANELMAASPTPDGFPLKLTIQSGAQIQLQLATALQEMWSQINVDVSVEQVDFATWAEKLVTTFDFDSIYSSWTHDIIDPDEIVSIGILPGSQESWGTGWVNQEAFDLAEEGRVTTDDAKRREIYYEVQRLHFEDAPIVFLYTIPYIDALNRRVKGFFHHPMGQYDLRRMTIER
jgi:peptide/nickel transport system substrate-binding protein